MLTRRRLSAGCLCCFSGDLLLHFRWSYKISRAWAVRCEKRVCLDGGSRFGCWCCERWVRLNGSSRFGLFWWVCLMIREMNKVIHLSGNNWSDWPRSDLSWWYRWSSVESRAVLGVDSGEVWKALRSQSKFPQPGYCKERSFSMLWWVSWRWGAWFLGVFFGCWWLDGDRSEDFTIIFESGDNHVTVDEFWGRRAWSHWWCNDPQLLLGFALVFVNACKDLVTLLPLWCEFE